MNSTPSLARIAHQVGTPFWVYYAATIRRQISILKQFDVIRVAQKACSDIHLLKMMRDEGVLVDSVSLGEIERALKAGFTPGTEPSPIVFTADLIDRSTLTRII